MKKALLVTALIIGASLSASSAFAQTAAQSVTGFLLAQGSTYGSYTCPSTATQPCFVQYGSTIPTGGGTSPSPYLATAVAGTQRSLSIATSTAPTVPATATILVITLKGTADTAGICAFWQDDGTAPTSSAGQPLPCLETMSYTVSGVPIQLIASSGSSGVTASISYYK